MICQTCGETNAPGDVFCQNCGSVLASEAADRVVIECPTCKTKNTLSDKYCQKCGSSLAKLRQMKAAQVARENAAAQAEEVIAQPVPVVAAPVVNEIAEELPSVLTYDSTPFDMNLLTEYASPKHGNICTYCGTLNDENGEYCSKCGKRVYKAKDEDDTDNEPEEKPDRRLRLPIGKKEKSEKVAVSEKRETEPKKKKNQVSLRVVIGKKLTTILKKAEAEKGNGKNLLQNKELRKYILIAAAALVVLILVIAIGAGLSGGNDSLLYDAVDFETHFAPGSGKLTVYANGKTAGEVDALAEPTAEYFNLSVSRGVFTLQTVDNGVAKNAVYAFTDKGVTKLLDTVSAVINLSADGSTLLYVDSNAALCMYDIDKNENTVVAENGKYISGSASAFALSPDGDYCLYCYKTEAGTNAVCIFGEGVSKDICQSGVPLAISDKGERVYYLTVLDNTYDFYCTTFRKPDRFKKIASHIYAYSIKFNNDLSEVLFTLVEGSTYYSKNGKQADGIASGSMFPMLCNKVNSVFCSGIATIYGIDTFYNGFWIGENGIYVLNKGEEPVMVGVKPPKYDLSDDGKSISFTETDGSLYVLTIDKYAEEKTPVATNATATAMTGDGKSVYYLDGTNSLFSVSDSGDNTKIADNVEGIKCTEAGIYYKVFSSAKIYPLYYCSNGKTGKEISAEIASFRISDGCSYYTSGDGQHTYYSKDGNKSFKQLY